MIREHSSLWRGAVVLLLMVHALLLLYGIRCHFGTRNEVAHVPAGLALWKTGTFASIRRWDACWRCCRSSPPC